MPIVVDPGTCDKESEKDWKKENVVDALREREVRAVIAAALFPQLFVPFLGLRQLERKV
jgi:hypothetical protein